MIETWTRGWCAGFVSAFVVLIVCLIAGRFIFGPLCHA